MLCSLNVMAQVYRCDGASGVTYSDQPCGEGAEEITIKGVVVDTRGVGGGMPVEAEAPAPAADAESAPAEVAPAASAYRAPNEASEGGVEDSQYLSDFLAMLHSQRDLQIGELDNQLAALRNEAQSESFEHLPDSNKQQIRTDIAALETNRADILSEYAALIEEAESRLD